MDFENAAQCPKLSGPGSSRGSQAPEEGVLCGWAADTLLLSVGGGLPPELPPRRGKPPPLLPPLLGPSGGDREPMGLGPPAPQLTPPPAPVGLRGAGLRGLQKDSGPAVSWSPRAWVRAQVSGSVMGRGSNAPVPLNGPYEKLMLILSSWEAGRGVCTRMFVFVGGVSVLKTEVYKYIVIFEPLEKFNLNIIQVECFQR